MISLIYGIKKWYWWTYLQSTNRVRDVKSNLMATGGKCCCSITQLCLTLQPQGLQHARLPCPSPSPKAWSNSCPLSRWYHPTISSSVVPFSSCLQSFPASGSSFLMSPLFTSGGQSIGAPDLASVLPVNTRDCFPLGSMVWAPCSPSNSQESSLTPQFKSINSLVLSLYGSAPTSIYDY